MTVPSRNWLMCLILTVVTNAACLATDSAQNSNWQNSIESVAKLKNPAIPLLKYKRSPTDDTEATTSQLNSSVIEQSTFPTVYRNPEENATGSIYYDLVQLRNKYYPKIKDLMRYVQNFENAASRVRENSPGLNHIAERVTDVKAAIGFLLSIPLIICCSAYFLNLLVLGGIVIGFNGWDLGTLGRRRMLRDLSAINNQSQVFDFDHHLTSDQSMTLALLVARVDSVLSNYTLSSEGDTQSIRFVEPAG
ncbi:uncharacterized protein LOC130703874 [Daphnia carinata]|uniref:uncharacterized protein LOC130703874 n=1 Tax=Daphnia carinata TaxID=120202 RepID=UPI00257F16D5|nr:uncharacterized protein LOC130703874 [Daphnia carinata]